MSLSSSYPESREIALWIVRESARPLAQNLAWALGAAVYPPVAVSEANAESNRGQFQEAFPKATHWVLIMASGIATRYLAGLPRSKHSDPAVVVVDEACRFAIPLLGGHEAGANALAYQIAAFTGATPVITTATEALKPLTLGIGCRRGMSAARIHSGVERSLDLAQCRMSDVREVATVDVKAAEPGLLSWLSSNNLPLRVFSTAQLAHRPLTATPSDWVKRSVGLAGVCEPCALLASPRGILLLPKTATAGVTVAIVSDANPAPSLLSCPAN